MEMIEHIQEKHTKDHNEIRTRLEQSGGRYFKTYELKYGDQTVTLNKEDVQELSNTQITLDGIVIGRFPEVRS